MTQLVMSGPDIDLSKHQNWRRSCMKRFGHLEILQYSDDVVGCYRFLIVDSSDLLV